MTTDRLFLFFGSVSGAVGVAAGAFAAHALRSRLGPELLNIFETGARYQMYHTLALLAAAWLYTRQPAVSVQLSGWLFIAGILIFSGSLYVLSLTGARWLGAITPVGGVCLLGGWLAMAWGALKGVVQAN